MNLVDITNVLHATLIMNSIEGRAFEHAIHAAVAPAVNLLYPKGCGQFAR
jgi:hypothetical protein